jgi:alpha-aminoadipic semialdehyde synthase
LREINAFTTFGPPSAGDKMGVTFGIRREDKNEWERRVPLVPADLANLRKEPGLEFTIQPSPIRVFDDDEFRQVGVTVDESLDEADIVIAVKEIPIPFLQEKKVYLFFSHTIKGQPYNMPMLKHLLDTRCTLIDYERVTDEQNRRLIFFSVHAGYAGMIESLVCLAQRMEFNGAKTPLLELKHAYEYGSLVEAKNHLMQIGDIIRTEGMGDHADPVIIGLAGYGNVSRGCQEILDCLPVAEIPVGDLETTSVASVSEVGPLVKVIFKEKDMVEPRSEDAQFVLQDYYQRPENYRGVFEKYLPHLDLLMNTIYWEDRYPRLVTRKWAHAQYGPDKRPRLQVIGDITCDIEGSIELTLKAPYPDQPCFVYDPQSGDVHDGVEGYGPVIMAVDNLPCELPRESSEHFSEVLRDMVPALGQADFGSDFEGLHLPPHLKRAVITHRGQLTPSYRYLQEALDKARG